METIDLLSTTDAMVWADQFVKTLRGHPDTADPYDAGFMVGWFANAMAAAEGRSVSATADYEPFVCRECGLTQHVKRGVEVAPLCNHLKANVQGVPMVEALVAHRE